MSANPRIAVLVACLARSHGDRAAITISIEPNLTMVAIGINSVTALAFRLDQGLDLDWTVIGLFTVSAVLGGLAGNRVVSRVNPARLGQAFAILLVAVAVYTAARSVPRLF